MHSIKASKLNTGNHRFDMKLEGLRGLCALVVAMSHLLVFNFLNSSEIPYYNIFVHLQFAHAAVLIFFIISGYVIGINHLNTPFTWVNVISYLKKRAIRLYPIYIAALLISAGLDAPNGSSAWQLIGHIFFTQEFLVNTISSNVVLWSLSYEVIYYLLFLLLWKHSTHNIYIYLTLSILIFIYLLINPPLTNFNSVITGWLFWMMGLNISQNEVKSNLANRKSGKSYISYFLIILSIQWLNTPELILNILHQLPDRTSKIIAGDILYLPICCIIIMELTNRPLKYMNLLKVLAYSIPAFNIFILLYHKHPILSNIDWIYGIIYFAIAIVTLLINPKVFFIEKLNALGKISYAIYVFHFPIIYFLSIYLAKYFSDWALLLIGLLSWIILTGLLSFITEIVLQPRIKIYFLQKMKGRASTQLSQPT